MDLATHQRKMLGLIRSTYQVERNDDPYVRRVAASADLLEARRNIFLWRVYVLERTCPLTFSLLKQRGLLQSALSTFISDHNISPFRETQAPAFLSSLITHRSSLVASVAQFELALMRVKSGDRGRYVIDWDMEPQTVLQKLAVGAPVESGHRPGHYQVVVSHSLPFKFQVYQVQPSEA